jgi:hypothetical protein
MRDIQVPGQNQNRGPVNAGNNQPKIFPAEQAKRYVAPPQPVKREYFEPKKSNNKKYLALGLFLSLLIISIIFFLATFAFDGATITITPQVRKDNAMNDTITISDLDRKDLIITKNLNVAENITVPKRSTKKIYKKAEGDIVISNNFGKDPQKFVRGTRFSTTDGKIFKLADSVTVPGKDGDTPGTISAHVIADQDGVEYNIGPTTFTIPGLKASPKYKAFSAQSSANMTGGASGNLNEVSDADLQKALKDIKDKLVESAQAQVGTNIPDGFTYNKDALAMVVSRMQKTSEDDNTATYTQTATATTVLFKRDDIVKKIMDNQYANSISKPLVKILDSTKLTIGIVNQNQALDPTSPITLTVTGPAPIMLYPNKQEILEYYAGRPVSEFNDITKKFQFVASAKRVIYPFWNTRFPSNISKIEVEFDDSTN